MCNGWNHTDGCECGFGPPYDRNVPDYFDQHVGGDGGRDLSAAGPNSARLRSLTNNDELTTQLVSTFLWQSYIGHRTPQRIGRNGKGGTTDSPVIYIVRHGR